MKKFMALVLALICLLSVVGCSDVPADSVKTIEGNLATYYEMSDGTWQVDGHTYKYRHEITGRLHNAVVDSTYVYLSNLEEITFDQAWKASGLSSNTEDYFSVEEAILVEMGTGSDSW